MYPHLLSLLQYIPKGSVTTYKNLACYLGLPDHTRQVGKLLSENKDLDRYPCYKVVGTDGSLTGYAGGPKQKEERLFQDGIGVRNGKIDQLKDRFWTPHFHSYFLAWPLDEANQQRFQQIYRLVASSMSDPEILSFQQPNTPHVTLFYFGDISFQRLQFVVEKMREWERQTVLSRNMTFSSLSFFGRKGDRRVGYFHCIQNASHGTQQQSHVIQQLGEKNDKPYTPHITFFRVKDRTAFNRMERNIIQRADDRKFHVSTSLVRLYCAIDGQRQIPLIDFEQSAL